MKFKVSSIVVICISLIIGLTFAGQSFAKIDPKTVTGLWLFDEGSGVVAKDSSGSGLNGKFTGAPQWVAGKFGKALLFDGKSYVTIPDHKNPTTAITLSAWVKSTTATWTQNGWILEKRDAYIIHPVGGSVNVAFCTVNGGPWNLPKTWDAGQIGPKVITDWHLYTCTFDSATGKWNIYIDGVVASSLDINKAALAADTGPAHIGWDEAEAQRFGQGTIDEVAIFNVALGADDVKSLMNGLGSVLTAVDSADKLATTWSGIKVQR
jgi:hypothetical protein